LKTITDRKGDRRKVTGEPSPCQMRGGKWEVGSGNKEIKQAWDCERYREI
jgi:hypothetical protein